MEFLPYCHQIYCWYSMSTGYISPHTVMWFSINHCGWSVNLLSQLNDSRYPPENNLSVVYHFFDIVYLHSIQWDNMIINKHISLPGFSSVKLLKHPHGLLYSLYGDLKRSHSNSGVYNSIYSSCTIHFQACWTKYHVPTALFLRQLYTTLEPLWWLQIHLHLLCSPITPTLVPQCQHTRLCSSLKDPYNGHVSLHSCYADFSGLYSDPSIPNKCLTLCRPLRPLYVPLGPLWCYFMLIAIFQSTIYIVQARISCLYMNLSDHYSDISVLLVASRDFKQSF